MKRWREEGGRTGEEGEAWEGAEALWVAAEVKELSRFLVWSRVRI